MIDAGGHWRVNQPGSSGAPRRPVRSRRAGAFHSLPAHMAARYPMESCHQDLRRIPRRRSPDPPSRWIPSVPRLCWPRFVMTIAACHETSGNRIQDAPSAPWSARRDQTFHCPISGAVRHAKDLKSMGPDLKSGPFPDSSHSCIVWYSVSKVLLRHIHSGAEIMKLVLSPSVSCSISGCWRWDLVLTWSPGLYVAATLRSLHALGLSGCRPRNWRSVSGRLEPAVERSEQ